MGRPRSEKARRAILKAAFQLLKRNGFDAVSMQQMAWEAKGRTATLYRWWDGKEAILLDAYLETTREALPYGKRGSLLRRLNRFLLRLAEFLEGENGQFLVRLMLAIQDDPKLRQAFYERSTCRGARKPAPLFRKQLPPVSFQLPWIRTC